MHRVDDGIVTVDGIDATGAIRGREVTEAVSQVAANPAVRDVLVQRQRAWVAERGGGVVEGRDIGSVVFPDADLKLYITASARVRAERRVQEIGGDVDDVEASILKRDRFDSIATHSPLDRGGRRGRGRHDRHDDRRGRRPHRGRDAADERRPETFLAGNGLGSRIFYQIGWSIVVPFIRLYTRLTINGREHLPDEGAFILAPVHRSYLDTPFAGACDWRRMRFMGKDAMWNNRQFGWVFSALGSFPVTRGSADREALQAGDRGARRRAIRSCCSPRVSASRGRWSSRCSTALSTSRSRPACRSSRSASAGSERVMPKKSKFIYPRKVHIEIGPPIPVPVAPEGGRLPRTVYKEQTELLHSELQRLFDLAMDRVPWDYPVD